MNLQQSYITKAIETLKQLSRKLPACHDSNTTNIFHQETVHIQHASTLLEDLNFSNVSPFVYWNNIADKTEVIAVGSTDLHQGLTTKEFQHSFTEIIKTTTLLDNKARYFCGKSFYNQIKKNQLNEFEDFGGYCFILPLIEFRTILKNTTIVFNFLYKNKNSFLELINQAIAILNKLLIPFTTTTIPKKPISDTIKTVHYIPNKEDWITMINNVHVTLKQKKLQKIALSRKTKVTFSNTCNAFDLLNNIKRNATSGTIFCIQVKPQSYFMGCTPEKLFVRQNRYITLQAIGGTISTQLKDADLSSLLTKKNILEHKYISDFIVNTLNKIATDITISKLNDISFHTIKHLQQQIAATLNTSITDYDLIKLFHPTPAVGTTPQSAIESIKYHEQTDRGWYASPLGWVGEHSTEFCVAIRSAVLLNQHLYIYSGAGIIKQSIANEEWSEISAKCNSILDLLGITINERYANNA